MKNDVAKNTSRAQVFAQPQLRFLAQSVRLEEEINPRLIRMTSGAIALCLGIFIAWACMTNINEIARTPGEIIPMGMQKTVQHLEGGIVKDIKVTDGQTVQAGQTLVVMDGIGLQEDLNRAMTHVNFLEAQRERLQAFIGNRAPDFSRWEKTNPNMAAEQDKIFQSTLDARAKEKRVLQDQIDQKKQSIKLLQSRAATISTNIRLAQDMYDRRQGLYRSGYISHISFLQTEQELNTLKGDRSQVYNEIEQAKMTLNEYEGRMQSLDASDKDQAYQQLNDVEKEIKQSTEVVDKLQAQKNRLTVTAPVSGLIKGLNVHTIGAVIQPGQVLMEIIPLDNKLIVEIRIPPQYAGHLQTGEEVQIKVSSYDFSRYGAIPGKLDYISPSTFTGERGERFYRGNVILDKNYVGTDPDQNKIMPGMTVMADIVTGRKTVMQYLMKPIRTSLITAFSER